jgi:hypothetical protein
VKVQPVIVSRQIGNEIVIAKGVKAGDHVITEIPQSLQPGAKVQLAGEGPGRAGKSKGKGEGKAEGKTSASE